jgi:hypothetical protein
LDFRGGGWEGNCTAGHFFLVDDVVGIVGISMKIINIGIEASISLRGKLITDVAYTIHQPKAYLQFHSIISKHFPQRINGFIKYFPLETRWKSQWTLAEKTV